MNNDHGIGTVSLKESIEEFLFYEAECVDGRKWDEWLQLFDETVEYWIPSWDSEHEYISDPQQEISLMYYRDRSGLEDRIFRLRTERSSASVPLPRTCHLVTNIRYTQDQDGACRVKANFSSYVFRLNATQNFFGHYEYTLILNGQKYRIKRKKIILLNDYIDTVLDIYSV
jgi:anthranilate 1,2-dioxygenase small subunit